MLSREDNDLICRVGPGTPMGATMRRYWHPIATSEQLPKPDCDPLRVQLLGEWFVVFRDTDGKVGVLDELCMHRGASLAIGRVEEGGIRCLYHGWKFDTAGRVLEVPNHHDMRIAAALKAPAYPVHEDCGLIWTYIGPREQMPAPPRWAYQASKPEHRVVLRINVACNYLQLVEGGEDSSHVGILHSNMARPGWKEKTFTMNPDVVNPAALAVADNAPQLEIEDTDFGYHYVATRRTDDPAVRNARVVPFIMPYGRVIPSPAFRFLVLEVPADDYNTSTFMVVYGDAPVTQDKIIDLLGLDDKRYYDRQSCEFTATWANRFGQNRARMQQDWTGLKGVEVEDASIGLSQGPLYDRSKEHLMPADKAVVRLRRLLINAVKAQQAGDTPVGVHGNFEQVGACDSSLREGEAWQKLMPQHRPLKAAA